MIRYDIMLYLISWSIPIDARVQCWNVFGNMTPADDLKDAGENINVVGRWHRLNGAGGVCVCDCSDHAALNSWMLNWSPICEISVEPVVDDAASRAALQGKPFFTPKDSGAEKSDSA